MTANAGMKRNLPHAFPGRRAPMTAAAASQARRLETRRILWRLAFMSDFQPVERIEGPADAGVLIVCDHASHALPAEYGSLGLPPEAFQRHIAYDIGAAGVTRRLAKLLNAPALLSCFSRLLIDPNRGADDPTLVMRISDGALIPGNARIDAAEIEKRRDRYWRPYREAAIAEVERLSASGRIPSVISIHSFTPIWKGAARPWHVALLWDCDPRLAKPLIAGLAGERDLVVGDNEPYDGALNGDTMYELGTSRGLPHALFEIRQDLIADEKGQAEWAERIARELKPVLADPAVHRVEMHPTRT